MTIPNLNDLESKCAILEKIADAFPPDSPERDAIFTAAQALHYVRTTNTQAEFKRWVDNWTQPPTALQVLQAKLNGIDLPHELTDQTMREVEQALERLRTLRK